MAFENQEYALRVKDLSKVYQVIHSPWKKFMYYVFKRPAGQSFYALKNISFDVKKGETFGIIGTNGSGKSTLLQVISGIIPQSRGEVIIDGKISALLELGSGFNPENTGYENIYLNAAILGVGKDAIEKKIDEIVQFADIGDFINEPVKTYSSGMFIRLAFAVAINVEADIIIIDEALAVGDVFFRQKCYAKLNELKAEGKTIILVSHGMNEVEQFCDRALLLKNGEQIMLGKSGDVVARYYMINQGSDKTPEAQTENIEPEHEDVSAPAFFEEGWRIKEPIFLDLSKSIEESSGAAHYLKVGLFDENGMARRLFKQGETGYIYCEIMMDQSIEVPINGVVFVNQKNVIVNGKNSFQTDVALPERLERGSVWCSCMKVRFDIEEGEYTFEVGFSTMPKAIYDNRANIPHPELNEYLRVLLDRRNVGAFAIQGRKDATPSKLKFYGMFDLDEAFDSRIVEVV